MATVVLAAAGALIGGPAGMAIGASIGNYLDRNVVFAPGPRQGARLSDLRVQSSTYGTQIPKLFGTMRVAGSVIWATDLVEHRSTQSGGKGQAGTTTYSYTASFAVALSNRPVAGVGRIWADGKLLRGAAGDFKVRTGFRLHPGGEDQPVDPLIAAAEGAGLAPAHRGIAYAVFEDLALADYGNRIPQLTFELIADPEPLAAGEIATRIAAELVAAEATPLLGGFSAQGASVRAALEGLADATGLWLRSDAGGLSLLRGEGEAVTLADGGATAESGRGARAVRAMAAADSVPKVLTLGYYAPARDYQGGTQRVQRAGPGIRETAIDLPAALDADAAKQLAAAAMARAQCERERRTVTLPIGALPVRPGERVRIDGVDGLWRVDRWSLERMVVKLECVRVASEPLAMSASGGRALPAADAVVGATVVQLFELPPLDDVPASALQLYVAAAGTGAAWRSAALLVSSDGGAAWEPAGSTAYPATLGVVAVAPGAAPAALVDRRSSCEVELAHAGMALGDADPDALLAGANLALLGEELIQFGRAERLSPTRWRLSTLLRGRRGTEFAIGGQVAGDRFVLVERDTLATLPTAVAIGSDVQLLAQGVGDASEGVAAAHRVTGLALVPPTPVHLRLETDAAGPVLRWARRSRTGWAWRDGIDAPLVEEAERYLVTLGTIDGATREASVPAAEYRLDTADLATLAYAEVRQIGTFGLSQPTRLGVMQAGEEG